MTVPTLLKRLGHVVGLRAKTPQHWPDVEWRPACEEDWPPTEKLTGDLDWVRRTGTGWSAEFYEKRWFLFDRDWFGWPDPPEWGLASFNTREGWRFYDDFDVFPSSWIVPKVQDAAN